jgi:hypothetical protein
MKFNPMNGGFYVSLINRSLFVNKFKSSGFFRRRWKHTSITCSLLFQMEVRSTGRGNFET